VYSPDPLNEHDEGRSSVGKPAVFPAPRDEFIDEFDDEFAYARPSNDSAPSLPVILVSAACGMAGGVLSLYITYRIFAWPVEWVAAATTLMMLLSLGVSGALMSAATGSRSAPANILFSCGLIIAAGLFMGFCLVAGALTATLLVGL
jgi:hypothetical protein